VVEIGTAAEKRTKKVMLATFVKFVDHGIKTLHFRRKHFGKSFATNMSVFKRSATIGLVEKTLSWRHKEDRETEKRYSVSVR